MSALNAILLVGFIFAAKRAQGSEPPCDGNGRTCYYINDPCPPGTNDCSSQYSCPVQTNKCCCPGCPPDWVEEGSNCYRAIPNLQKAIDARNECKKLGADLPVIKSTEENTFFLKLTEDRGETWLGMYADKNNDFHWVDGTSVADTFSAWAPGEPNYPADEHCAYIYVDNYNDRKGKWNNHICDAKHYVVCQKRK